MTDPDPNQGPSACFRRKTPDRVIRNREHYTLMSELRQRDDRQAGRDRLPPVPDESPPSRRTQASRPRWAAPPSARPTTRSSGATTPRVMTTTSPSPERLSGSRPTRTMLSRARSSAFGRPGPRAGVNRGPSPPHHRSKPCATATEPADRYSPGDEKLRLIHPLLLQERVGRVHPGSRSRPAPARLVHLLRK